MQGRARRDAEGAAAVLPAGQAQAVRERVRRVPQEAGRGHGPAHPTEQR